MNISKKQFPAFISFFIFISAAILYYILAAHNMHFLIGDGLHINGVIMPCNNDAYYFLEQAYKISKSGADLLEVFSDQRQSILLPYLLSFVSGSDKMFLLRIGSYIGPILGLSMLLAVLPWAVRRKSAAVMILSSCFALFAPYWITRTQIGFLDTDCLVPGLCSFALFSAFKFSTSKIKTAYLWGLAYIGTVFFLWFWWRPGAMLSSCFILLYLFYPARNRFDKQLKCMMLFCFICVLGALITGYGPFAEFSRYILAHINLAFGGVNDSILSQSIVELEKISFWEMLQKSCVSSLLIIPAIYGIFTVSRSLKIKAVLALFFTFLSLVACISQRFIPLFIPLISFMAACGIADLGVAIFKRFRETFPALYIRRKKIFITAVAGIIISSFCSAYFHKPYSYFNSGDYTLAKLIRKDTSPDALIWTWWDYGYFFRFLTDREVLFDGGSQSYDTCFLAAYPLIQSDMDVAAKWMNYFSAGNIQNREAIVYGAKLEEILKKVNSSERGVNIRVERPVVLCLPQRVYTAIGFLYSFAHIHDREIPPVSNHLDIFTKSGFTYDNNTQVLNLPHEMVLKGYSDFGTIINASGLDYGKIDFDILNDPYLIYSDKADFIVVTDKLMISSVLFRLLGLFDNDNDMFSRIFFDYRYGGVWAVH